MKKVEKKHFECFKKYVKKYIELYNLDSYQICIGYTEKKQVYAECFIDIDNRVGSILLCKDWFENTPLSNEELEKIAKHEVIHLMLSELYHLGRRRFISLEEFDRVEEGLVRKLEKLLC